MTATTCGDLCVWKKYAVRAKKERSHERGFFLRVRRQKHLGQYFLAYNIQSKIRNEFLTVFNCIIRVKMLEL